MEQNSSDMNKDELNNSTESKKPNEPKKNKEYNENKKSLSSSFKDFRGEFRKIIWPNRSELTKKTTTVVVTSLCFGLIIFAMDTIFSFGYTTFVDLLSKI